MKIFSGIPFLRLLLWWGLTCLTLQIQAQSFRGRLTYRFTSTITDDELLKKIAAIGMDELAQKIQKSKEELLIRDGVLTRITNKEDGSLRYKELLDDTQAIIVFPLGKVLDFYDSGFEMPVLELQKRTGKHKFIAGYRCRRYDYQVVGSQSVVTAWITDEIPYDRDFQSVNTPFFNNFFFEEGIVLEKTLTHPSATNHWILDAIERYDVPQEEIYELFDSRH